MMRNLLRGIVILGLLGLSSTAYAFSCPSEFAKAEEAISRATSAMESMADGKDKALVHTLIDDAKMYLEGARHNHKKPAAGGYDHARSVAKARSAKAFAEAAHTLAGM